MEIEKMVQLFNEEHKNLKEIGEIAGMSKSTVQRRITSAGYVLNKEKTNYSLNNVSCETLKRENTETINNHNNVSIETREKEKQINGSYTIPASLARGLKYKAIAEDKKVIDIVREALEKIVEDKYLNM